FACDLPPDQIGAVQAAAGFEVQGSTILNHRVSVFDHHHPALENPLVRRALTHSIDRQAIIEALWGGQTEIPAGLQFESFKSSNMFIEGWTVPEVSPELARDLLRQANYNGEAIPYRLLNNYDTNQTSTGQILTEMWNQVGLNVESQMVENWGQIMDAG